MNLLSKQLKLVLHLGIDVSLLVSGPETPKGIRNYVPTRYGLLLAKYVLPKLLNYIDSLHELLALSVPRGLVEILIIFVDYLPLLVGFKHKLLYWFLVCIILVILRPVGRRALGLCVVVRAALRFLESLRLASDLLARLRPFHAIRFPCVEFTKVNIVVSEVVVGVQIETRDSRVKLWRLIEWFVHKLRVATRLLESLTDVQRLGQSLKVFGSCILRRPLCLAPVSSGGCLLVALHIII